MCDSCARYSGLGCSSFGSNPKMFHLWANSAEYRFHISMKTDAQMLTKIEKKIVDPLSKMYLILIFVQASPSFQGSHPSHWGHMCFWLNGPSHMSFEGMSVDRVLKIKILKTGLIYYLCLFKNLICTSRKRRNMLIQQCLEVQALLCKSLTMWSKGQFWHQSNFWQHLEVDISKILKQMPIHHKENFFDWNHYGNFHHGVDSMQGMYHLIRDYLYLIVKVKIM